MNDTLKRCLVTGLFFLSAAAYAQTPVCEWTMAGGNGTIPNGGSTGSAGNLSLTSGARLSDDVLPQNTGGNALQILGGYPTASAESAAAFDPLAGAGAFTIMGWVRRESASAGVNQSARLWSDIDTRSSRADGVEFRLSGAAGLLSLRINGQEVQSSIAGVAPDNGAWHHVAVVYDGSRAATNYNSRHVHFYIDGIQMGYGNVLSGLVVSGNTVPVTIGNSSADRSADNALVGSIDDVFVFRGWAPPPSGNGNPNPEIQSWLLLDDSTRIPGGESSDRVVPPVLLGEVQVQKIGNERLYENLKEGVIFLDGASGELYVATQDAPHGRAVCSCREWPDWHNFTNTLHINGNRIELNRFFSMQAEGNSLSIRTGTNSVFQIVGSDIGDYAPVYATPESQESYLLTANVQAEQAVLQVCTNLLEANGWRTDTVSEIIETTDASVTWRVPISAGTEPEFRRVLSATQMPAGIYARQQLVAEQGIEMAGERWDAWPDVGSVATNAANAAVANRATVDALAEVAGGVSTNAGNIATNTQRIATLEETLDDLGVEPEEWKFTLADGSSVTKSVGVASNSWSDTCTLFWSTNYMIHSGAATNDVYVYVLPTNFPTRKLMVYVDDTYATNICIATAGGWIPDHDVEIVVFPVCNPSTTIAPNRFITFKVGTNSPNFTGYRIATISSATTYRKVVFRYYHDIGAWTTEVYGLQGYPFQYDTRGQRLTGPVYPTNAPATVEEWLVLRSNQTPSSALSMSASPQLVPGSLSPAIIQPVEDLDGMDFEESEEEEER